MTFLALIIALGLLQHWGSAGPLHRDEWFARLAGADPVARLMPELQVSLLVLAPALLVGLVQVLVGGWLFGLLELTLMVAVLLYAFGRRDFDDLVDRYRDHRGAGDTQAAHQFARDELAGGADGAEDCPAEGVAMHRWVKQRLCYFGFERWFGVIFYFALLGPAGALAYRLLHLHGQQTGDVVQRQMVARVLRVADWVPARLLVLAFAVTGDWVAVNRRALGSLGDTHTPAAQLILDAANAALALDAPVSTDGPAPGQAAGQTVDDMAEWEVGELRALLSRSAVAWVVVLSLLVLLL